MRRISSPLMMKLFSCLLMDSRMDLRGSHGVSYLVERPIDDGACLEELSSGTQTPRLAEKSSPAVHILLALPRIARRRYLYSSPCREELADGISTPRLTSPSPKSQVTR
jgi:hypothetical protein